jgi:hypothetical protein
MTQLFFSLPTFYTHSFIFSFFLFSSYNHETDKNDILCIRKCIKKNVSIDRGYAKYIQMQT